MLRGIALTFLSIWGEVTSLLYWVLQSMNTMFVSIYLHLLWCLSSTFYSCQPPNPEHFLGLHLGTLFSFGAIISSAVFYILGSTCSLLVYKVQLTWAGTSFLSCFSSQVSISFTQSVLFSYPNVYHSFPILCISPFLWLIFLLKEHLLTVLSVFFFSYTFYVKVVFFCPHCEMSWPL